MVDTKLILTIEYKKQWYKSRVPTWATLGEAGMDINISSHVFQTNWDWVGLRLVWFGGRQGTHPRMLILASPFLFIA